MSMLNEIWKRAKWVLLGIILAGIAGGIYILLLIGSLNN